MFDRNAYAKNKIADGNDVLHTSYHKANVTYELIKRTKKIAMYSLKYKGKDLIVGYDVFKIRKSLGIEYYAYNKDWGATAYSWTTAEKAEECYESMTV